MASSALVASFHRVLPPRPLRHTTAALSSTTHTFTLNLKMIRVKDPKVSLDFYSRVMGTSKHHRHLVDPIARFAWTFGYKTTLELTHNWGSETGPDFKGYHIGNSGPRGFGCST